MHITQSQRVKLGEAITLHGPGILAFDGDREISLATGEEATLRIERLGPNVIDVDLALRRAAERNLYLDRAPLRDGHGILPECC